MGPPGRIRGGQKHDQGARELARRHIAYEERWPMRKGLVASADRANANSRRAAGLIASLSWGDDVETDGKL